ncbi:sensor histidine kinase [Dehalococcoides mccartyi]|uniref:histidine kinase n=1 Tax=Dehalococcoides mccartyi (strain VS) TaxID=311424 RepID=D2BJB1_DEHMV|nr:PAS domain-containing sensor histidine kinase [Dehalococcoides mccartyi]ACZ62411.1 sensor histidine kinase [Dehalococcoides mccartyi VS]
MSKESIYNAIFCGLKNGIVLIDRYSGTIMDCNPEFENISGRTKIQLISMKIWDLITIEDNEEVVAFFNQISTTGDGKSNAVVLEKVDGSRITVEFNANTIINSGQEYLCTIVRDITLQRKLEEQLQSNLDLLKNVFDNMSERVAIVDYNMRYIYRNKGYFPFNIPDAEEVIGKSIMDIYPTVENSDGYKMSCKCMNDRLAGSCESCVIVNDKSYWLRYYFQPIKEGLLIVITDITEHKLANQRLSQIKDELEKTIEKRHLELIHLNEKLKIEVNERKNIEYKLENEMSRREYFTRALVHELKTPLTAIISSSEGLQNDIKRETAKKFAKNIQDGASTLNRRIDELLDITKGEIGILNIHIKPMDIKKSLEKVLDSVSPEIQRRNQTFVLSLPAFLPLIKADEERFQQVVINLINNALKFNKDYGRIFIEVRNGDASVIFTVRDEGLGVREEDYENIFMPYFCVKNIKSIDAGGLGLGLALSKMLVELHGGKIWVENHEDGGAILGFSLPV